jgi:signal transduction histidine kinase
MNDQLHIFICEHFKEETLAVLSLDDFHDVIPSFFPSRCNRPLKAGNQLSSIPELNAGIDCNKTLCGCSCMNTSDRVFLSGRNIRYLNMESCFQMFAAKEYINSLICEGAYLITPGWLSDWRECLTQWGGQVQAQQIFSESISKLVLLDTGIDSKSSINLEDFSEVLNCHAETIKVGLDLFRLFLENEIYRWRLNKKMTKTDDTVEKIENTASDYAMALDLLSDIPRDIKEEFVANKIMELLIMLFAASKVCYLSIIDNKPGTLWAIPLLLDEKQTKERLMACNKPICITESGKGFCLRIGKGEDTVAVIEIDDFTLPEHMLKYQNLALAIAEVFATSIENARYFEKIIDINNELKEVINIKDKFFSIIAHDLRNPFVAILGYSEMLIENIKTNNQEAMNKGIKIIAESSNQAYTLLENLLTWARAQTGRIEFKKETFDLKKCIDECVGIVVSQASKKNIIIVKDLEANCSVSADRNMINTVLRNLLVNAIKYSHHNSKIIVAANIISSQLHISVYDYGVGISKEKIDKLFRIDTKISTPGTENEKGSGLGLILCKEFIEKHNGKIWVESEVGKGSGFHILIPWI